MYESFSSDIRKNVTKSQIQITLNQMERTNWKVKINSIDVEISGDTATATVTTTQTWTNLSTGEKETMTNTTKTPLVREDGKWKVDEPPRY